MSDAFYNAIFSMASPIFEIAFQALATTGQNRRGGGGSSRIF